nr:MAG TPA: hypothetical protein [Bacteriophage sp.]
MCVMCDHLKRGSHSLPVSTCASLERACFAALSHVLNLTHRKSAQRFPNRKNNLITYIYT